MYEKLKEGYEDLETDYTSTDIQGHIENIQPCIEQIELIQQTVDRHWKHYHTNLNTTLPQLNKKAVELMESIKTLQAKSTLDTSSIQDLENLTSQLSNHSKLYSALERHLDTLQDEEITSIIKPVHTLDQISDYIERLNSPRSVNTPSPFFFFSSIGDAQPQQGEGNGSANGYNN